MNESDEKNKKAEKNKSTIHLHSSSNVRTFDEECLNCLNV